MLNTLLVIWKGRWGIQENTEDRKKDLSYKNSILPLQ